MSRFDDPRCGAQLAPLASANRTTSDLANRAHGAALREMLFAAAVPR